MILVNIPYVYNPNCEKKFPNIQMHLWFVDFKCVAF